MIALTDEQRAILDELISRNATDRALLGTLVGFGLSRHDAFCTIDSYVYGDPSPCPCAPTTNPEENA